MFHYDVLLTCDVESWLKSRPCDTLLLWWGKAAEAIGLDDKADPATALRVLGDGVGPGGKRLASPAACTCEEDDCVIVRSNPPVSYLLKFHPHETVRALAAEPATREAVLEEHWKAARTAALALENTWQLELVGVEATSYIEQSIYGSGPCTPPPMFMTEAVFAACVRDGGEWRSLGGTSHDLKIVLPMLWRTVDFYQRTLGEELGRRLGVEVAYENSPHNSLPIAVVKS